MMTWTQYGRRVAVWGLALGLICAKVTGGEAPVPLGSAAEFGVLAAATTTSTGPTTINGDLGVSAGSAVTGFPPGIVNGSIHAGNPTAARAQADLTAAYLNAQGRMQAPVTVAGNLGGQTLPPGLYKSTSSLAVSSGDLTLDAGCVSNAVYIFQIASSFTTTSGRRVILAGGADPANIFWQVGSSATLGTASVMKGTIMAMQSITLATGATVDGRVLARFGGVTMDANTVTRPQAGNIWAGAVDLGNGWKWLNWFGYFNTNADPWIRHQQHGWMYVTGTPACGLWLWTADMGYLWTTATLYPSLYRAYDGAWLWYSRDSVNPRSFYNFQTQAWEAH
jgi:hypothetical protein